MFFCVIILLEVYGAWCISDPFCTLSFRLSSQLTSFKSQILSSFASNLILNPFYLLLKFNNCMFTCRIFMWFFCRFQFSDDVLHLVIWFYRYQLITFNLWNAGQSLPMVISPALLVPSLGVSVYFPLKAACWPWKTEEALDEPLATCESTRRWPQFNIVELFAG